MRKMNDLIKRQDAIDEANAWLLECLKVQKQDRSCGLIRRLEDLPSAKTKGHWRHYEGMLTCSNCNAEFYDDICDFTGDDFMKFCPDCGCDMRGEEE